jgi:prolycopene isomerase
MGDAPKKDSYDVVVVGSGLGGVACSAFLARAGRDVLLVEQADAAGGYAHVFARGDYKFDPAIHGCSRGKPEMSVARMLEFLGVGDRCTLLPAHDVYYSVSLPGLRFDAPYGPEQFVEAHAEQFPAEADQIRAFVQMCVGVIRELEQARARFSFRDLDQMAETSPIRLRYRRATLAEVLDEHFTDPKLKSLMGATWPNLGLSPDRLAFIPWAGMMTASMETGHFYVEGSFQNMVDAFVGALELHGGELVLGNGVTKIPVEDGKATGVVLADGSEVRAPVVVSNADARQTFDKLVGHEHLPAKFVRRLERLEPSVSAFVVYTATKLDLAPMGLGHVVFAFKQWDHEDAFRRLVDGKIESLAISLPTLVDPALAPEGEHLVTACAFMPYDIGVSWTEHKDRFMEGVVDDLEELFPGFREQMTFCEAATPYALERYTLNTGGAAYGWANTPNQAGSRKPSNVTPLEGLYLTGHWTQPGSGSLSAVYSGLTTAQMVEPSAGPAALRSDSFPAVSLEPTAGS